MNFIRIISVLVVVVLLSYIPSGETSCVDDRHNCDQVTEYCTSSIASWADGKAIWEHCKKSCGRCDGDNSSDGGSDGSSDASDNSRYL